jgi:hypothetical protein
MFLLETAIEDQEALPGIVAIVTGKIDFDTPSHIPPQTDSPEMFWRLVEKLLDFLGLGKYLLLAQTHAIP